MRPYSEYLTAAGYDDIVDVKKEFAFAYKNGEAKKFDCWNDAIQFSKQTEKVCINQEEFDANCKAFQEVEGRAQTAWMKDLREEYSSLSDKVFNICYSQAYEDGHSAGYDEIRNYMYSTTEFAEAIISATKEP
jgi:flagellar biosynthesis/type III secretory pathway protein FliH